MNVYAIVAAVAVASFAAIEVLIAYQKYQLKKQALEDLDRKAAEGSP